MTPPLRVELLPIDRLAPAPYNPRREVAPGSSAWRKLEASLDEFGLVDPLVWNRLTGRIVGGHLRLRILQSRGVTEVPVAVVELDEGREKALNVVLNNREAQGSYDPDDLASLLDELDGTPLFALTGFEESILDQLRLEPLADLPEIEGTTGAESYLVGLVVPGDKLEEARGAIDELCRRFDITCRAPSRIDETNPSDKPRPRRGSRRRGGAAVEPAPRPGDAA